MGEYNLELEDRLYTSTEVAKILGVSLRSVYRYLEDEKLEAEMKTATGRHRFTKQNILDFLYPQKDEKEEVEEVEEEEETPKKKAKKEEPEEEVEEEEEEEEEAEEEDDDEEEDDVDWLSKFRKAAEKYKAEEEEEAEDEEEVEEKEKEEVSGLAGEEEEEEKDSADKLYYTSEAGGLKEVAQKLDKSAKKASLDYAFTMQAGLSLHKPISPFSVIHAYVKSEDLPFFEKILDLTEAKKDDAQLCLIVSDDDSIYDDANEMHGLNVVEDEKLKEDLLEAGEKELAEEL